MRLGRNLDIAPAGKRFLLVMPGGRLGTARDAKPRNAADELLRRSPPTRGGTDQMILSRTGRRDRLRTEPLPAVRDIRGVVR